MSTVSGSSPSQRAPQDRPEAAPTPGGRVSRAAERLPGPLLWVLGVVLVLAGLGVGAFVMARGAQATGEYDLDVWFGERHDAALNVLSSIVDIASGPVVAPLATIAVAVWLWLRRHRVPAVAFFVATFVGWLSVGFGKLFFHRERPPMQIVHALSFEGKADSFPSGHVAYATAVVCALALVAWLLRRSSRLVWLVGVPLILVDGVMRLYAGAHYLGDVVAAPLFALGAISCLAALWATLPLALRGRLTGAVEGLRRR